MAFALFPHLDATQSLNIACAAVSAICAVVQVTYARKANQVALKIATDQAAEAARAREEAAEEKREALRRYIEAVLYIGKAALAFTGRSLDNLPIGAPIGPSHSIPSNWRERLIEYRSALDVIRGASPPNAGLLVSVARLSRILQFPAELPQGPHPIEQTLKQVQGSLSLELNAIRELATAAGCRLGDERQAA